MLITNQTKINLEFSGSDIKDLYLTEDVNCTVGGVWQNPKSSFALSTGDGDKNLYYRARDKAGNITSCQNLGRIVRLDQTLPVLTGLQNETQIKGSHSWSWSCTEVNSPCSYSYIISKNATSEPIGVFTSDTGATQAAGNGIYCLAIQARDLAGNISALQRVSVELSAALPTLVIKDGVTLQNTLAVELVMGGDQSVFNKLELSNTAGCVNGVEISGSPLLWNIEAGDGLHEIYYQFVDGVGAKTACASLSIGLDQTAPVITGLAQDMIAKQSKTLDWSCTEIHGPCQYRYEIDKVATTLPSGSYGSDVTATRNTGDGAHYIHIQARDRLGNESVVSHYRFDLDNTAPTISIGSVSPASGDFRTGFNFTVSYGGSNQVTLSPADIVINGDTDGCLLSMTSSGSFRYFNLTGCTALDASLTFSVKPHGASDVAGNLAPGGNVVTVVNNRNPLIASVSAESSVEVVSTPTLSSQFKISLSANAPTETVLQYSIVDAYTTALPGVDHNLPVFGTVTIPAGQREVVVPFNYFGALRSGQYKSLKVSLTSVLASGAHEKIVTENQTAQKMFISSLPTGRVTDISMTSSTHACFVMDGDVYCWGANGFGQLGNGTKFDSVVPTKVVSGTKFTSVKVSGEGGQNSSFIGSTCALSVDNDMYCWGKEFAESALPVQKNTSGPEKYKAIALGLDHYCTVSVGNILKCSGFGASGARDGLSYQTFVGLVAGKNYTCGISSTGTVSCVGANTRRRLADVATTQLNSGISLSQSWSKVSVGINHTCGIRTNGLVGCWGYAGDNGKLGNNTISSNDSGIVFVSDTDTYKEIAVNDYSSCGITVEGNLKCWGHSPVAKANSVKWSIPTVVDAGIKYTKLSGFLDRFCGVTETGLIRCFDWGKYQDYAFVRGNSVVVESPIVQDQSATYQDIQEGAYNRCGLTTDNEIRCWGIYGYEGLLVPKSVPMLLDKGTKYKKIAISVTAVNHGVDAVCGITPDADGNKLRCIGASAVSASNTQAFSAVAGSYKDIAIGAGSICAVNQVGEVKCWGTNDYGQLGNNSRTASIGTPVTVSGTGAGSGLVQFESISSSAFGFCAVSSEQSLWCWGKPEIRTAATDDRLVPVEVDPGFKVESVSLGYESTCMIGKDSGNNRLLKCWGKNTKGELGLGDIVDYPAPTVVSGFDDYVDIKAGNKRTCALKNSELYCWGEISAGVTTLIPQKMHDGNLFKMVSRKGSCGLDLNNKLNCWGSRVPGSWDFGDTGYKPFYLRFGY